MNDDFRYVSKDYLLRLAREQALPTAVRLHYAALSRCDVNGRAEFTGWQELGAYVSTETGSRPDKSTIYKAIKRAIGMELLAADSSPSCLVLVDGYATDSPEETGRVERDSTVVEGNATTEDGKEESGYSLEDDW